MEKILLVILSLTLFSLIIFMVRGDREGKPAVVTQSKSFIEGLKIIHRHDAVKDWVLTAKRADIDDHGDRALLTDMEIAIAGKGIAVFADKGSYDMNTRKLTVEGKVVAKGDSYSIASEGVEFDGSGGGLKADGGVNIQARKFSVRGTGMDADNDGQTVRIRKNVTAIFHN